MIFFFALGLIMGGFFLRLGGKKERTARRPAAMAPQVTSTRLKMVIPPEAPNYGPRDAAVTIVAFDDFQCPWCAKAATMINRVMKDFPQDVRFVLMNFPLTQIHKEAEMAAEAAMEANNQGKFRELHDLMFANQKDINRANIEKWAKQAGMDVERLKNALDKRTFQTAVQRQVSLARSVGVGGTPTILINGRRMNLTRDMDLNYRTLKGIVQEEIQTVKQQNIPPGQAWQRLTADGVSTLDQMNGAPRAAAAEQKPPQPAARREVDPNVVYRIQYDPSDAWKGDPNALVTIVEFSEYQCPHCKKVDAVVDEILAAYPQGVKFVFLHNPMRRHPQAHVAAVAALEVLEQKGLEGFWKFHKVLFENSPQLQTENIEKWLQEAGVDMARYKASVENRKHEATISRNQALAIRFGARGTPAFFINGYFLSGARTFHQYKPVIDREMEKAKQAIAEGKATAENYYQTLMANAEATAKWIGGEAAPSRRPRRPRLDHTKTYRVFPEEGSQVFNRIPFFGDPKGQVVVAMGIDVECGWCEKLLPVLDELMEGSKVEGDAFAGYKKGVRFVVLHYPLPFHRNAPLAHQAIQEVFEQKGPETFYKYFRKVMQNQKAMTRENLETWAQELGVNMPRFKQALDSEKHKEFVAMVQSMARGVGIQGTPSVFVNGKFMLGRGLPIFRRAIDDAMSQAENMMKEKPGLTADKVYEEIMKTAEPKAIWIQPPEEDGSPALPPVQIQKVAPSGPAGLMQAPGGPRPLPVNPVVVPPRPGVPVPQE